MLLYHTEGSESEQEWADCEHTGNNKAQSKVIGEVWKNAENSQKHTHLIFLPFQIIAHHSFMTFVYQMKMKRT